MSLCQLCKNKTYINDMGLCKKCKKLKTSSYEHKYCKSCANKLNSCEHCGEESFSTKWNRAMDKLGAEKGTLEDMLDI